jgi:transposase-like protein
MPVAQGKRGRGKEQLKAFPWRWNARDEELFRLRKENEDLREANEILKKAMAFFAVKAPR